MDRLSPLIVCTAVLAGEALLPHVSAEQETQEVQQGVPYVEMVVVSYNINHGEGMDGEYSIERIASTLAQYEPDIVALQEVDMASRRTREDKQAEILARRLRMYYVFGPNVEHLGGQFGNAILSRYPILSSNHVDISPEEAVERRTLLRASIDVEGVMLELYTVHLGTNEDEQAYQLRRVMRVLDGLNHDGPVLLMGDMEMEPSSELLQPLFRRYLHAGSNCGPGANTYPTPLLTRRHDFLLMNTHVTSLGCVVPQDSLAAVASDHLPVVATAKIELF